MCPLEMKKQIIKLNLNEIKSFSLLKPEVNLNTYFRYKLHAEEG